MEPSPNIPATGRPTISGTAQVGETLTAQTGDFEETLTSEPTSAVAAAEEEESPPTWSAKLTVGRSGSFYDYWESEGSGELAPDEFNLEGKAYTVLTLMRYTDQWFIFTLDQALPGDFTLQVGETTLSSKKATINKSSSRAEYQWQNGTLRALGPVWRWNCLNAAPKHPKSCATNW